MVRVRRVGDCGVACWAVVGGVSRCPERESRSEGRESRCPEGESRSGEGESRREGCESRCGEGESRCLVRVSRSGCESRLLVGVGVCGVHTGCVGVGGVGLVWCGSLAAACDRGFRGMGGCPDSPTSVRPPLPAQNQPRVGGRCAGVGAVRVGRYGVVCRRLGCGVSDVGVSRVRCSGVVCRTLRDGVSACPGWCVGRSGAACSVFWCGVLAVAGGVSGWPERESRAGEASPVLGQASPGLRGASPVLG
ncbi:hypothetical protein BC739_005733 [Kutzneria viridogrisea]|uniref:Uncharacterized protein n=1 Tax=Kutzneria viridogrisea TaxID=47990 RepID=A0ABR6BNN1_9PSEU|nr:hypothetical protein [Kutzneria viridogrisea]